MKNFKYLYKGIEIEGIRNNSFFFFCFNEIVHGFLTLKEAMNYIDNLIT